MEWLEIKKKPGNIWKTELLKQGLKKVASNGRPQVKWH